MPLRKQNRICFVEAMPEVVQIIANALNAGGRFVCVVKDQRLGRKRLGSFDMFAFFRECSENAGLIFEGRRVAILPDRLITQWQRVNAARWGIPIPNVEHVLVMRKKNGRKNEQIS